MTTTASAEAPTIRYATEADVPLILSLIHELASYEHAAHEVKATEASLGSTLSFPISSSSPTSSPTASHPQFTPGYARTLLIFPLPPPTPPEPPSPQPPEAEAAGFALFYPSYSTWLAAPGIFLEDLFVRPEYRRRGYGKLLLNFLAGETLRVSGAEGGGGGEEGKRGGGGGAGRLEWNVLKWNKPSIDFYTSETVGASPLDEWVGMRVEGEGVRKLAGGGGEGGG